jgi:hypothetical protein
MTGQRGPTRHPCSSRRVRWSSLAPGTGQTKRNSFTYISTHHDGSWGSAAAMSHLSSREAERKQDGGRGWWASGRWTAGGSTTGGGEGRRRVGVHGPWTVIFLGRVAASSARPRNPAPVGYLCLPACLGVKYEVRSAVKKKNESLEWQRRGTATPSHSVTEIGVRNLYVLMSNPT